MSAVRRSLMRHWCTHSFRKVVGKTCLAQVQERVGVGELVTVSIDTFEEYSFKENESYGVVVVGDGLDLLKSFKNTCMFAC